MSRQRAFVLAALLASGATAQAPNAASTPGAIEALVLRVDAELERQDDLGAALGVWISPDAGLLSQAFETALLAHLGARGRQPQRLVAVDAGDAERAARESGLHALLRLEPSVASRQLLVRGDLLGTRENFWSGRATTRPVTPAATLVFTAPADAQVLALALPRGAGTAPITVERLATFTDPTAGLAAADLDGDGRPELVALVGDRVHVLSGSGTALATFEPGAAHARSRTPCREPYAVLSPGPGDGALSVFSCAWEEGLRLQRSGSGELTRTAVLQAPDFQLGDRRATAPLESGVAARKAHWRLDDGRELTWPGPVVEHATARGANDVQLGLLLHADGSATFLPDLAQPERRVRLTSLATASTLVDLHGDGTVALATTSPSVHPEKDVLTLLPLPGATPDEGAQLREPVSLPGAAMQLLAVDLDGDGAQELVVGCWRPDGTSELLRVRFARSEGGRTP